MFKSCSQRALLMIMILSLMLINCVHVTCDSIDVTDEDSPDDIVPEFDDESIQVDAARAWDAMIPGQYRQEELRDTGRFKPCKSLDKKQGLIQSELEAATVPTARSEILRFMTPFGVAMHKYADVTPWAGSLSKAEFIVDIATYVPTARSYYLQYDDENATTCRLMNRSYGDGWGVSASLVLWDEPPPDHAAVSKCSRADRIVPIVQGQQSFTFGTTEGFEATWDGTALIPHEEHRDGFDRHTLFMAPLQEVRRGYAWEYAYRSFVADANATALDLLSSGQFDGWMGLMRAGQVLSYNSSARSVVVAGFDGVQVGDVLTYQPRVPLQGPVQVRLGEVESITRMADGDTIVIITWQGGEEPSCLAGHGWTIYSGNPEQASLVQVWLRRAKTRATHSLSMSPFGVPAPIGIWNPHTGHVAWKGMVRPPPIGTNVTVIASKHTGRLLHRMFNASIAPLEEAYLVMTLTGHGQYADLQCGEFCELRFKLHLDGHEIGTFSQEAIQCERNPVNPQMGTWDTPRGTWCPGSVVRQPGATFRVSEHLRGAIRHHLVTLTLEARNYDAGGQGYGAFEAYTNNMTFTFGGINNEVPSAYVALAMELHVYKHGMSRVCQDHTATNWFSIPEGAASSKHVPLFVNETLNITRRSVAMQLPAPDASAVAIHVAQGKQVGLLFQLGDPKGGEADNWDRMGSMSIATNLDSEL